MPEELPDPEHVIDTYHSVVDLISEAQMISKSFLDPDRNLSEIYNSGNLQELADSIYEKFKVKLTKSDVTKAKTIKGLALLIITKRAS